LCELRCFQLGFGGIEFRLELGLRISSGATAAPEPA